MDRGSNACPYVHMSGSRDSKWCLDYLPRLLPSLVPHMTPSVNLITSLRAPALCSQCDNRYCQYTPQKPLQSIDLAQRCHSVASQLQCTVSLKICRVLWGKVSLDRLWEKWVVLVHTLPSLWTQRKIAPKSCFPHQKDTMYTTHQQNEDTHDLIRDTRDKNIRDIFKANSREYGFARKALKEYAADPFSEPLPSYWLFITVNRQTWLELTEVPLSSLNSCRF